MVPHSFEENRGLCLIKFQIQDLCLTYGLQTSISRCGWLNKRMNCGGNDVKTSDCSGVVWKSPEKMEVAGTNKQCRNRVDVDGFIESVEWVTRSVQCPIRFRLSKSFNKQWVFCFDL